MKKILSISLLLSVLFLYGCSTSDKLSADQLFEKKQECASYKDKIEKEISENRYLEQIFYSASKNTCMYEYTNTITNQKIVVDYFTKNIVNGLVLFDGTDPEIITRNITEEEQYNQKLKELKGE